MPAAETDAVLAGDGYTDSVRRELASGQALGITGVPFAVLAGRYAVAGVQSVGAYAEAIRTAVAPPA